MDWTRPTAYNAVSYDCEELIRRANTGSFPPPADTSASTASGFASWVFSLSHPGSKKSPSNISDTFDTARLRELEIASLMAGFDGIQLDGKSHFKANAWRLEYADPLLENQATKFFEAPRLTVEGAAIRCKPDVVLYNTASRELLIVERKVAVTSDASIPEHCYPNVLAQLWCYAHIDFTNAGWPEPKGVLLAAEIWSHKKSESAEDGGRRCWLWRKSHPVFTYMAQLFELYRGLIESRNVPNAS